MAKVPDKLAIVTDEISLTYRALNQDASRIAACLGALSTQHDQPIVLFVKNDAARVAAMLGVLKAGRISIPLAPSAPEKWLTQIFEDSAATQIIVDAPTRSTAHRRTVSGECRQYESFWEAARPSLGCLRSSAGSHGSALVAIMLFFQTKKKRVNLQKQDSSSECQGR